jgi:hypothetical protein
VGCEVDVVIITWNDGPLFDAALSSALASADVAVRVIAVDNGSEPPVLVPEGVTLIRNDSNRGVAPARNQGVRAGTAPFVCLLDSDARLDPDCLACLVAALRADAALGLAAPVFVGQAPAESAGRAFTLRRKVLRGLGLAGTYERYAEAPDDAVWSVDFAIGACQVFRREAFDAVGGLDEDYFYGPEDVDFCLRIKRAGFGVAQVAAAACHHPPRRRNRRIVTRRGLDHTTAIARHSWRHRRFRRQAAVE